MYLQINPINYKLLVNPIPKLNILFSSDWTRVSALVDYLGLRPAGVDILKASVAAFCELIAEVHDC